MTRQTKTVSTLLEAMPYIQRFSGTTIVIKYGGAAMTSRRLQEEFARDVVLLQLVGMRPIVVHGGGPQVSQMMERLGMDPQFVRGHRVTDEQTMEVAKMVLVGKVNKDLVGLIHRHGGTAVGLSGEDGQLLVAERLAHHDEDGRPVDLGLVGRIRRVNTGVIRLLSSGVIPVVASIGANEEGQAYNVNADTVAGALAAALDAEKLVLLTDVPGVLVPSRGGDGAGGADCAGGFAGDDAAGDDDPGPDNDAGRAGWRVIDECTLAELDALEAAGGVRGGMVPKLAAARAALQAGVRSAHVVDGRVDHALLLEVLTDAGCGTKVVA
jgi:acetylglutamate kinase